MFSCARLSIFYNLFLNKNVLKLKQHEHLTKALQKRISPQLGQTASCMGKAAFLL